MAKIFHDINLSEYFVDCDSYRLYFSSELYKRNFLKRIDDYKKEELTKLKIRYRIAEKNHIETINKILIISLYKKIEKRGYKIEKIEV